jgi:hypothetical protein
VASFGTDASDKSVMVSFSRSGSAIFPESRVVYFDDAGNNSNSTLLKAGETFVDVYQSSGVTRWGDYSGVARKQNSSAPEVWLSGSYGAAQAGQNALNTWVGQITGVTTGIPVVNQAKTEARVFPNPTTDRFNLEFVMDKRSMVEIAINDASGRRVKLLLKDMAEEGKNLFTFNKGALASGIYFLEIKSGKTNVANEKIVIE